MTAAALEFIQVSKRFGQAGALDAVSFSVASGSCFGLVGENGAGKTTLLKCLLDFCTADQGTIQIQGKAHQAPHARAALAYLPERFVPPYYLTAREFLHYMLELQGISFQEQAAVNMLEALDLDLAALNRPVRSLSKGMTQKLGLAACLLSDKQITILDEPASGLDPKAHALLKRQLHQMKAAGRTVLLTSHALEDVTELCDHMAVLHRGRVQFCGTPAGLCASTGERQLEQAFLRCIGVPAL